MSRNYVAVNKDLEKLQACEQIAHPRTPESPGRACWEGKKLPPHNSCVAHGDGEPLLKLKDSGPEKLDRPVACIYHQNKYIVSDWGNDCLKVYNKSGKCLYKIENQGKGDGQLCGPWGLCVQKCDNYYNLTVCNTGKGRVDQFTLEG